MYPCFWFDGQAKAAADFYCTVFENTAIKSENPMVVIFEIHGKKFMGLNGGPMHKVNPSISFFVSCETEAEIDETWKKLSEGGSVLMPLNTYPWSEKYGWCQDQFGINWQLMLETKEELGEKITASLMFTQLNAGRTEEAIQFYTSLFKNSKIDQITRYEKGEHDVEGTIKYSEFTLNGQPYRAMDSSGPHAFSFDEGISIVIDCETQEEIDYFWDGFAKEGKEDRCGWVKDKFGVSWQIVPTVLGELMSDPQRAGRVVEAFMKMKKFDIETLLKA